MNLSGITSLSIGKLAELLEKKELSSSELCSACIEKVKETDPRIRAFLALDEKHVMDAAADNIGETSYQLDVVDSNVTVVCVMRYNGSAFRQSGGFLCIYSRLAIWEPKEMSYEKFVS